MNQTPGPGQYDIIPTPKLNVKKNNHKEMIETQMAVESRPIELIVGTKIKRPVVQVKKKKKDLFDWRPLKKPTPEI